MQNSKLIVSAAVAISAIVGISAASAADLPARTYTKAPMMVDPTYNWSGFYIGAHVGGAWAQTSGTFVDGTPPFFNPIGTSSSANGSGIIGGGQAGVNWQMNQLVLGIEGDISGADFTGRTTQSATLPPYPPGTFNEYDVKVNWLATVTGRVGFAFDKSLLYVKGGVAFMNADYSGGATIPGTGVFPINTLSTTRTGWTIGAGYEQAFAGNWSWKLEYDYMHFGTDRDVFVAPSFGGATTTLDLKTDVHTVKAGINYRFGWAGGPVVARY